MDNYNDSLDKIGLGFRNSGEATSFILLIVLILIVIFIVYRIILYLYRNFRAINAIQPRNQTGQSAAPKLGTQTINTAQIKVIYDLITEFKKKEILAEAIPVSVLEHFSEYFFRNIDRLRISKGIAQILTPGLFPLTVNTPIEIEIIKDNKLYIFERNVLEASERKIAVPKIENISDLTVRGQNLVISYTSNKIYIRGESRILSFLDEDKLILSYPKNLVISNERRFARVPMQNKVEGYLNKPQQPGAGMVQFRIKDISMEGVRIETSTVLKKNTIYTITFEDHNFDPPFVFENFECTITKSLISNEDMIEYGLAFVYISLASRSKLVNYINGLVQFNKI